MANDDKDSGAEAPKKSKKKLLIMVVGVLLIVASGAGFMLMSGGSKSGAAAKPSPGTVFPLDAITVNLAGGHYLKVQLALQGTSAAGSTLDGNQALDLTISEFSDHTMAEFATQAGRDKAKTDLLKAMAATTTYKDKVMDIYFAEFVMQ